MHSDWETRLNEVNMHHVTGTSHTCIMPSKSCLLELTFPALTAIIILSVQWIHRIFYSPHACIAFFVEGRLSLAEKLVWQRVHVHASNLFEENQSLMNLRSKNAQIIIWCPVRISQLHLYKAMYGHTNVPQSGQNFQKLKTRKTAEQNPPRKHRISKHRSERVLHVFVTLPLFCYKCAFNKACLVWLPLHKFTIDFVDQDSWARLRKSSSCP
jgi:hypothetical protein